MRLLHTSDWHLGHTLRDWDRAAEHAAFLAWLLSVIDEERPDALLIAGDIFDSANPPASAQEAWYDFLAAARKRSGELEIIVIGGNHDSPARLDAPNPLLRAVRVHMVGGVPRTAEGSLDLPRMLVQIRDAAGRRALVAAVPFLRPGDLPPVDAAGGDPLIEGVRSVYRQTFDHARTRLGDGDRLVAMGHLYLSGTQLSETSERPVLGGNQHALPADLFPEDIAYVALGHLHRAQRAGGPLIRYAGSPIPLSMAEADYKHQVVLVDLHAADTDPVRPLLVPRHVEIVRVPDRGAASLADVLPMLRALPDKDSLPAARHPFLEVVVTLDRPEPALHSQVQDALVDRAARLVKVTRILTGTAAPLAEATQGRALSDLTPEQVFLERYRREYSEPPSTELLAAFHELLASVAGDST